MSSTSETDSLMSKDPVAASFAFQLEMLRTEIGIIDNAIARIDGIMQTVKNWAITVWTGSLAVVIASSDFRDYAPLTAIVPLLFWIVNTRWAYYLRGFIYRQDMIAKFLNGPQLVEAFGTRRFPGDFYILDPRGAKYRKTGDYKRIVNMWRSFKYLEHSLLYASMIVISLIVGAVFWFIL